MQYYAVGSTVDDTHLCHHKCFFHLIYCKHVIFMLLSASINQNLSQQQPSHFMNTKLTEDCTSPLVTSLFTVTYE